MSYVIKSSSTKGNCVVAANAIKCGELIVTDEKPFVWNCVSIPGHNFHKHCGGCGLVLRSQLFEGLGRSLELSGVSNGMTVLKLMQDLIPVAANSDVPCSCARNCDTKYCSAECRLVAQTHGHDWLCEKHQTVSDSTQQMQSFDEKGHFGLACKVYARIAAQTMINYVLDSSIDVCANSMQVAIALLTEFHYDDFTRTMHSYRTGRIEIDPSMFETVIFPAYFSAHLAAPLALTKDIFAQSGPVLWGTCCASSAIAQQCSDAFLSSDIFSEQFYSRIIGMFTVNCLSVHVPSPLDFVLSEALREQAETTTSLDPAVLTQIVTFLRQQLAGQQNTYTNSDDDDESDVDAEPSRGHAFRRQGGGDVPFLGMSASGLFSVFSKTNHSCLCNTSIHGSDRVTVSICAAEDISAGSEITNCYIHHDSINSSSSGGLCGARGDDDKGTGRLMQNEQHRLNLKMTKKQRYRALRQYMFECACPLCLSQDIDSDEDSD